jgi:hypothetical protein
LTDNTPQQGLASEDIDTSRPHPARIYDYLLGGYDNYEVDRQAAEQLLAGVPGAALAARANRAFLRRAVRVVAEAGVRQFLDLGTGIPTSPNTHEVAREVVADARVVYVDNDPIVAAHAGARLTSTPGTGFFSGDVRDPKSVLDHPVLRELIDFGEPVGLVLVALLHFIADDADPESIVAALTEALPGGSYLILSHGVWQGTRDGAGEAVKVYQRSTATITGRSRERVTGFFEGFDLLEPGLVPVHLWRPDPGAAIDGHRVGEDGLYGGVGRKR